MNEQKPYIEFQDVHKAFGSNVVLDGVSFNVMPGETVCILGRSGVGKSVSLHLIMGFLKADRGRIDVAYEDITNYGEEDMERIRKKVTMVFQNGALFDSLTVGENVAFPLRERGGLEEEQIYQIVDGLLDMVGVREFRDLLPSDLSTGMKRSVAIARALAAQPDAVLYDEPTTMVDPLMAHLLGDLIKKLKQQLKLTSIVVTHDMALAKKLADRVMFLYEAKAIFFGTFPEMARCQRADRAGVPGARLNGLRTLFWRATPATPAARVRPPRTLAPPDVPLSTRRSARRAVSTFPGTWRRCRSQCSRDRPASANPGSSS